MDALDLVVEEIGALLGGVVNAYLADQGVVGAGSLEGFDESGGEPCAGCEVGGSLQTGPGGDGHDAGEDGDFDAG